MIVQCPACQSRYRISDDRIPAKGGNLKCPSCGHVFPVVPGGATATPAPAAPSAAPAAPAASAPAENPLDEVARALLDQLDDDDWLGGGSGSIATSASKAPADTGPPAPSGAATEPFGVSARPARSRRPVSAGPSERLGGAPEFPDDALDGFDSALDNSLDDELAAVLAAASASEDDDVDYSPPAPSVGFSPPAGSPPSGISAPTSASSSVITSMPADDPSLPNDWKVKSAAGLVFDFPDRGAVRKWLGSRDSHDGFTVSRDGGTTWTPVTETPGVQDVKPSILKAAAARRTAELAAIAPPENGKSKSKPTTATNAVVGRKGAASSSAATSPPPRKEVKIKTSEGHAVRRGMLWLGLLILVLGGLGGLHVTGIFEIPGLRSSTTADDLTLPPLPGRAQSPGTAGQASANGADNGNGDPDEAERARAGMRELYATTLSRARRYAGEGNHEQALAIALEAIPIMPNNPQAFCLAAEIAEQSDPPHPEASRHRQRCDNALASAARAAEGRAASNEGSTATDAVFFPPAAEAPAPTEDEGDDEDDAPPAEPEDDGDDE